MVLEQKGKGSGLRDVRWNRGCSQPVQKLPQVVRSPGQDRRDAGTGFCLETLVNDRIPGVSSNPPQTQETPTRAPSVGQQWSPDVPKRSWVILVITRSNRSYHYLGSTDEDTEAWCLAGSPMFVMKLELERAALELMLSTMM